MKDSSLMSELTDKLYNMIEKNVIRYTVQKQMFCPNTGDILDYRSCILIEVFDGNKVIDSNAFSPLLVEKLTEINKLLTERLSPSLTVKFTTLNKKINHPLLNKLK
jgi:hypothetical protein